MCYPVTSVQSQRVLHYRCCPVFHLSEMEFRCRRRTQVHALDILVDKHAPPIPINWLLLRLSLITRSDCEVFPKNHAAPFSKVLTFYRKEPFTLDAYYNNLKELPYPNTSIGTANSISFCCSFLIHLWLV